MIDIESVVTNIVSKYKEVMQDYIDAMEEEKQDDILSSFLIKESAYYEWFLEDYPEFISSFVLSVEDNPRTTYKEGMEEVALTYTIHGSVILAENSKREAYLARIRYNRIIREILFNEVIPSFPELAISFVGVRGEDARMPNDVIYQAAITTFTITIGGA